MVKSVDGPSVRANVFRETYNNTEVPTPRPEDEVQSRFERVDPEKVREQKALAEQDSYEQVGDLLLKKGASLKMITQWERLLAGYKKGRLRHCMAEYREIKHEIDTVFKKYHINWRIDQHGVKYDKVHGPSVVDENISVRSKVTMHMLDEIARK